MTPDEFEKQIVRTDEKGIIDFCMEQSFIKRELFCTKCRSSMKMVKYKRNSYKYAWRGMNKRCIGYKKYISIRSGSFFENLNISIQDILRILIKYAVRQPQFNIKKALEIAESTVEKVISKFLKSLPELDFSSNKLGGSNYIVQVDETMLNYKAKSHRGRSPRNRTDSLCIVEFGNHITRAFATVIPNKCANTIVPIICRHVDSNTIISTDEHGAYCNLSSFSFVHGTVCHKYEFVNRETGVNTQAIESFHNELKLEIKRRKGIRTE